MLKRDPSEDETCSDSDPSFTFDFCSGSNAGTASKSELESVSGVESESRLRTRLWLPPTSRAELASEVEPESELRSESEP